MTLRVCSALPGRLRLDVPRAWADPAVAAGVAAALTQLEGVEAATVNAVSGRALLLLSAPPPDLEAFLAAVDAAVQSAVPLAPADARSIGSRNGGVPPSPPSPPSPPFPPSPPSPPTPLQRDRVRVIAGALVVGALGVVRLVGGPAALAAPPLAALTVGATVIIGLPTFVNGLRPLLHLRAPEIDTLITTATAASLLVGEAATGLVVVWLIALGELVEELTIDRTRRAIADLLAVGEEWVWVLPAVPVGSDATEGMGEVRVHLEDIQPGDVVVIHAGEKIPVDGEVLTGAAAVNQAPITGESLPVFRNPGDEVYAGTLVESGSLLVRAAHVGGDTAIGRIIRLVEEARDVQAPVQRLADRFSRRIVPLSFLLAGGVFALTGNVLRSMTILVIACPCAAGLATPTAVSAAIASAARRGILIKGGLHLETAGSVDAVVFDKTGTLTAGAPRVTRVLTVDERYGPERILALAASGELHSQHPLASAVLRRTAEQEIEIPPHSEYEIIVGHGVRFAVDGTRLVVGSRHMLDDYGVPVVPSVEAHARRLRARGETVLWVAEAPHVVPPPTAHAVRQHPDGTDDRSSYTRGGQGSQVGHAAQPDADSGAMRSAGHAGHAGRASAAHDGAPAADVVADVEAAALLADALVHDAEAVSRSSPPDAPVPGQGQVIGLIGVSDVVRPEAVAALAALRQVGVRRTYMITGDSRESAEAVARQLSLDAAHVSAEALPEEKFHLVRRLQAEGYRVALVGDGINDAPALAAADVGIAMGHGGADVALEAADIALAADDVRQVAEVIRLSRDTMRLVRQNFGASLGINGVGVLAGTFGLLSPFAAALVHNVSTVAVVLNSGRSLNWGPRPASPRSLSVSGPALTPSTSQP